jgi:hypothetical protein
LFIFIKSGQNFGLLRVIFRGNFEPQKIRPKHKKIRKTHKKFAQSGHTATDGNDGKSENIFIVSLLVAM